MNICSLFFCHLHLGRGRQTLLSKNTKMAEGGAKLENEWGTNKIKSVSICLRNTHVHGELEIQKKNCGPPLQMSRMTLRI